MALFNVPGRHFFEPESLLKMSLTDAAPNMYSWKSLLNLTERICHAERKIRNSLLWTAWKGCYHPIERDYCGWHIYPLSIQMWTSTAIRLWRLPKSRCTMSAY